VKIYEKIVIDLNTGKTIAEKSFNYNGPVAECKGGGDATTTYTYPRELEQIYQALMPGVNRLGGLAQTGGWGSGAGQWGAVPGAQYLQGMKQQNLGSLGGEASGNRVLKAMSGMTSREKAEYLGNLGGKGGGVEGGKDILRHLKTLGSGDRLGYLGDLWSCGGGGGGNDVRSRMSPYYGNEPIENLVNRSGDVRMGGHSFGSNAGLMDRRRELEAMQAQGQNTMGPGAAARNVSLRHGSHGDSRSRGIMAGNSYPTDIGLASPRRTIT
jgi:hypothetical protein